MEMQFLYNHDLSSQQSVVTAFLTTVSDKMGHCKTNVPHFKALICLLTNKALFECRILCQHNTAVTLNNDKNHVYCDNTIGTRSSLIVLFF